MDEDVQACAGTHVTRTGDIGTIKILNTERVQDGVERITFAAGTAAIEHIQSNEDPLLTTAATFDVAPSAVPANAVVDEGKLAVLGSGTDGAQFVVAVPDGVSVDAGELVKELTATVGGGAPQTSPRAAVPMSKSSTRL